MHFIFVGGSQRSGTTVLQKFLCRDATAVPKLAEASYLRMLMQAYKLGVDDFEHDTSSYFSTPEDFKRFNAGLINSLLNRTLAQYPEKQVLILKEPHLTQLFVELFELVPVARFVVIMRDPRDIIASMIQVGERMKLAGQAHFFQTRDMQQLSHYVKSFYAPGLNCQNQAFKNQMLVIRYEDLIEQNDDFRMRLSGFTGLQLNFPEPLKMQATTSDSKREKQPRYQPWFTRNSSRDINNSSIGQYKKVLSRDEIEMVENHCSDIIELFQYRREC